jgi:phosphate-selective porin OprO and OprP
MKQKTRQQRPNSSRAAGRPRSASRNRHRGQRPTLRRVPRQARSALVTLLATLPLHAHAEDATTVFLEPNSLDQIWNHATLYKDDLNPILQEFKLRGRYQGQYWDVDADQGSQSDWEDRRARFGFDAKLFDKKVEVRADFQSNDGFEDVYDGLVDAYLRWKPKSWLSITAGKMKPLVGHYDWLESTNTQPTFERSQIFNQLRVNRATGLTFEGTKEEITWRAGVYSNDTPANTADANGVSSGAFGDGEFGDFKGGWSFSLGGGYDFKHILNLEKADFRLDWLHSERDPAKDKVLNRYDDILSATFWLKEGDLGLVIEGFYGTGADGTYRDVFGFFIQPTYDIIPKKLQLVGRYSYAHSEGPIGVSGQSRYERVVAGAIDPNKGRGDTYQSIYGGAQYFICGDKLKLMAGAEYTWLDNDAADSYDGLTLLTGVRLSF